MVYCTTYLHIFAFCVLVAVTMRTALVFEFVLSGHVGKQNETYDYDIQLVG